MASVIGSHPASGTRTERIGVVVHPSRDIDLPLHELLEWAQARGVAVVQVPILGYNRTVTQTGAPGDCDLIVSIGGDGTMLAAMRAAVAVDRPALGVSCGSLGVLTTISAPALPAALDRFRREDWVPRLLPALVISREGASELFALNDIAVVRAGIGQVRVTTRIDGILFSRLAGDGCIVSTPLGSSAYGLAAGGPLLTPDADAYVVTPLPTHGGSRVPLVVSHGSRLDMDVTTGIGGSRLEIDGQVAEATSSPLSIGFRADVAKLVTFNDQEPLFTALRRRQIIADSPRILAEDARC